MDNLFEQFAVKLRNVNYKYKRFLYKKIDWNKNLIIIKGTRRVGKTTLALQYVKNKYKFDGSVLYISSDNIYFTENSLPKLAEEFVRRNGKCLIIDEIHKYPDRVEEINLVLKKFENLKLILIGSSLLDYISEGLNADESCEYFLPGLSFREFIKFTEDIKFKKLSFEDIVKNHVEIGFEITKKIDPTVILPAYLKYGYYPFYTENRVLFEEILTDTFNSVLEADLSHAKNIDFKSTYKMKELLSIILRNYGEVPNIKKISDELAGPTRGTVLQYIDYLAKAGILSLVRSDDNSVSYMTKPEEILFQNTNLLRVIFRKTSDKKILNKIFFYNQVSYNEKVTFIETMDFVVNGKYKFRLQDENSIINLDEKNTYHATDGIDLGVNNKIPLWMFGFMY